MEIRAFCVFAICIGIIANSQAQGLEFKVGKYVRDYATIHNILWSSLIISDNNFSMLSHPLPDIRCFDSKGNALLTLNCMAGIEYFVDSVNADKVKYDPTGEPLADYLRNNTILTLDGIQLTPDKMPKRKYYIFYSYRYNAEKSGMPSNDLQVAFKFLNNAHDHLDSSKAILYNVCITGIAVNNTKFIH